MTLKHATAALIAAGTFVCAAMPAMAQDEDFDLSQQRRESQLVNPVTGKKIDHKGIIINPTPQELTVGKDGRIDIREGLDVKDRQGCFSEELQDLVHNTKGLPLTVDFGEKYVRKYGLKDTEGAYYLRISGKGIMIAGRDETGAFYGIQTFRQLLKHGRLPDVTVRDWPDLPYRGVVEGFYGTPWSHEVRLSLIDFYGKFKMNTYVYGPKDDPYHSSPDWRKPYPTDEAEKIRELTEACCRNHVDFVWAIHPGKDIKWDEEDYGNLVNKFQMMYDLGVRAFAIFFDDISGEGTNPVRQVELLNRLNKEFILAKGDVAPLIMCPTDYSKLWANPSPDGPLSIYGRTLDPSIQIFWTGDSVCSDLTAETMEWVNSRIKRPALYWWNFPVTDYARHIMMEGPAYGLDTSLTRNETAGVLSNPMEHGEASKIALYGVADYTWNVSAYNALDNWERGLAELVPEATEAFRTFAIHSCDTETGYRRDESWETKTFGISGWTQEEFDALRNEFEKIEKVPGEMEAACSDDLLLNELRPWLTEFGKLGTRGRKALDLIAMYGKSDMETFWSAYVDNMMTEEERQAYEAHKCGTFKLQPFYENTMDSLGAGFYKKLTGQMTATRTGIGSFANLATILNKLMFDNDSTTWYTSGMSQKAGDWIGADLGEVTPVYEISILQGRNSVDDVDYFDHARLECSADGRKWTTLIDDMEKQYIVKWTGDPVEARYVRLLRLDSPKTNWASVRSFDVNPVTEARLGFPLCSEDNGKALSAFDRNVCTRFKNSGTMSFGILPEVSEYVMLFRQAKGNTVTVSQVAADGNTILETVETGGNSLVIVPAEGAAGIEISGDVEIFEIIPLK